MADPLVANVKMTSKNEWVNIRREEIVVYFALLSQQLWGGTEKIHEDIRKVSVAADTLTGNLSGQIQKLFRLSS